ncbi:hypothetical protein B0H66DRAFT_251309 [Apodospora peruviana]|uniref:Uncharacterized protein n=1 Tax=Apodospora peruviana TaxID=516989 RepID=A0AAE0HS16_9PEZI|nr:hypothetical protein B0H66DRAFT_104465 [Apodospora peruviana]KAK3318855.1 hypothetical protein B0H66DRAFT_251309 [Apodospora peruviana]
MSNPDLNNLVPPLDPKRGPVRHQASCVSLSARLLSLLDNVLPEPPALTLSVGSGPGLLEAYLLKHYLLRRSSLYGVEVAEGVSRFLAEENMILVPGTWAVAGQAEEAAGLMFVYPRQAELVSSYLEKGGAKLEVVVWIGPRCDEDDFTSVLREWGVEHEIMPSLRERVNGEEEDKLVENGEVVVVYRRRELE